LVAFSFVILLKQLVAPPALPSSPFLIHDGPLMRQRNPLMQRTPFLIHGGPLMKKTQPIDDNI
jgi:hypothetical protein